MTIYTKTVVNVQTGEQTIVDLTPEEIAETQAHDLPPYVPPIISDRQFFQQAAIVGIITQQEADRKSTRLNSSHLGISYAVFCFKKKKNRNATTPNKQLE